MIRFDKATYLSLLFIFYLSLLFITSYLSVKLSNSLWGSDFLLFLELINVVFIFVLYLYWIHYILYTFLVISFARYKEYMICLILFNKFSDVLPAFTCARTIGNLWSICLGVNILRLEWSKIWSIQVLLEIFR